MTVTEPTDAAADIQRIVESARRLGIEVNEEETIQWLAAISLSADSGDVVVDTATGTFGHRVKIGRASCRERV